MVSKDVVFWDVDTQVDFMLPGGKLYVPGAEKLIPNMKRLVDAAREGRVFLAGDADSHSLQDEEFKTGRRTASGVHPAPNLSPKRSPTKFW